LGMTSLSEHAYKNMQLIGRHHIFDHELARFASVLKGDH
jgi:hypothetical protein